MKSLWKSYNETKNFDPLKGDLKTDVLIIGGGLAGILTAYMLNKQGIDYALIEAGKVFNGVSGNTTAKITAQHGLIYNKLIKQFGIEKSKLYLEANLNAIDKFSQLCQNIDCDFVIENSYVYSLNNRQKLEEEMAALESLKYKAEFLNHIALSLPIVGAIKFENQAQFNPVKFINEISKKLNIYENTRAISYNGNEIVTNNGKIKAKKIIVTTHFPFINKHGSYFLKMYQERSYVIALENAPQLNGMYVDENKDGFSFRGYKELMILGGGTHRTGKPSDGWKKIREFAKIHYPTSKEIFSWATQDCITLDSIPYIGRYSKSTPNLYVATGFNKWGMTSSMIASLVLCDLINEKENKYSELFTPSRSILHPQLILNGIEAVGSLLTPAKKRCPHLGCALKWNPHEHSWDCPCHGSRFDEKGKLINNPSNGDI
ncbi:MAG: FAD-dependent oxidoreductase [Clostridia bacterium]|nr:FAD-dependent oxidoreductase [Clostridia bacterium]